MFFAPHPTEKNFPLILTNLFFYLDKLFQSLNLFQIVLFEKTLGEGIFQLCQEKESLIMQLDDVTM